MVADGLSEGEEIATNGTFKIDAAAQLQGLPSMMNPEGGKTNTMPGMVMPGDDKTGASQDKGQMNLPDSNDKTKLDTSGTQPPGDSRKINVSMDFTMQLNKVYDKYIILKNAFVSGKEKDVKAAVNELHDVLAKVDMNLLSGKAMTQWMNLSAELNNEIKQIKASDKLDDQRKEFSLFNDSFYKVISTFGLMGKTVYYQFCPMMNDNKGAYWLSETKDIRNPYYGDAMLTCGETKETLKY